MSTFVGDAMMREAARVIEKDGVSITAEFVEGTDRFIIKLTEAPYTELVLEPRKP